MKKTLGVGGIFCIVAGDMISSGLFVLPSIAFALAGPAMILAYLFAALLYIPAICAQVELATAMPRSGGSYYSVERSMGAFAGTLAGLTTWISTSLKCAFAIVGIGTLAWFAMPSIGEIGIKLISILACFLLVAVNIISAEGAGRLQIILVTALIGVLCVYIGVVSTQMEVTNFSPFFHNGYSEFLAVTGMVFVSYGGLMKVVDVAEEVDNPKRNLPLGMFLAFVIMNGIYFLVISSTVGILDAETLSNSYAPIAEGARVATGKYGALIIAIAACVAHASTGNAGILGASRSPLAMSRDGLLPKFLSHSNKRFKTPTASILLTGILISVVILCLSVEDLIKTASAMLLLTFVLTQVAVIVMRRSGFQGYRPSFKMPLHPWIPITAIIVYLFLIAKMGAMPLILSGGFLALASLWYLTYVHWRIDRESAIVYMVKNVVAKEIPRTGLEDELMQLSLERDGVETDRFDDIIKDSLVIDIEEEIHAGELFSRIGKEFAPRLNMSEEKIEELLFAREHDSSTVIQPGLAIPHIIVDGENIFELGLVRCKGGIIFSELNPPVYTAFVLLGSNDERNFHLKALVAIAHLVQSKEFKTLWANATNEGQLRDIVSLLRHRT